MKKQTISNADSRKKLLTAKQAAGYLRISLSKLNRRTRRNVNSIIKVGFRLSYINKVPDDSDESGENNIIA